MKKCQRCNFELDDVDVKANACPVCEHPIDPRRDKTVDARKTFTKDERESKPL